MPAAPTLLAGRYRLGDPLGRGGMGQVWLARDEMLDRDVAIKEIVLPPELMAGERDAVQRRTLREARAAARLSHPHVVQVYDVLQADGRTWIVMEYVRSRSLQEVVAADGPLDPARAARIGLQILSALVAAHNAGVRHRDVKPANVLLADDDRVVLTDFGIATIEGDSVVTRADVVIGSPEFMAPERARHGTATPATDLWSLGATLYTAVEGRSPFHRESTLGTLTALATEEPDPPQRAGALAPVLAGLLRKDPDARIDAAETERRLRTAADGDGGGRGSIFGRFSIPRPRGSAAAAPVSPAPPAVPASSDSAGSSRGAAGPDGTDHRAGAAPAAAGATPVADVDHAEPSVPEAAAAADPTAAEPAAAAEPTAGEPAAGTPPPEAEPTVTAQPTEAGPGAAQPTEAESADEAATPPASADPQAAPDLGAPPPAAEPATAEPPSAATASPAPVAPPPAPTSPAPGVVYEPARRRRQRALVTAAVALALVVGAVTWLFLRSDDPGRPTADAPATPKAAATTPATTTPPATAPTTAAPTGGATGAPPATTAAPPGTGSGAARTRPPLPAGWREHRDRTGFSVYVPAGWRESREGTMVYFRGSGRVLGIDQTDRPKSDPVADWRSQAGYRVERGDFPGYDQIRIESVRFWRKAADWEFTFGRGGSRQHVNNRGFVVADDQAYGIYWQTRDAEWDEARPDLQLIFDSFRPDGS
jgi:hypothetical protein